MRQSWDSHETVLRKSITLLLLQTLWTCLLTDPGKAKGCSINSLVINSLIQPFPPTALRRRYAQTVGDTTSSYKIDYVIVIKTSLNPEGHQNPISGSKVMAILLKRWVLPIGGASSGRVCACSLRSRLVLVCLMNLLVSPLPTGWPHDMTWHGPFKN